MRSYKFLVVSYGKIGKATVLVPRVLGHDVNPSALKNLLIKAEEA